MASKTIMHERMDFIAHQGVFRLEQCFAYLEHKNVYTRQRGGLNKFSLRADPLQIDDLLLKLYSPPHSAFLSIVKTILRHVPRIARLSRLWRADILTKSQVTYLFIL